MKITHHAIYYRGKKHFAGQKNALTVAPSPRPSVSRPVPLSPPNPSAATCIAAHAAASHRRRPNGRARSSAVERHRRLARPRRRSPRRAAPVRVLRWIRPRFSSSCGRPWRPWRRRPEIRPGFGRRRSWIYESEGRRSWARPRRRRCPRGRPGAGQGTRRPCCRSRRRAASRQRPGGTVPRTTPPATKARHSAHRVLLLQQPIKPKRK